MELIPITKLPVEMSEIESKEKFIGNYNLLQFFKDFIKQAEEKYQEAGIAFMQDNKLSNVIMGQDGFGNDIIMLLVKEKTDRYDTPAIYKALNFTPDQIAVLPANPKFKKKQILKRPECAIAYYFEEKDKITIKPINTKYLKGDKDD